MQKQSLNDIVYTEFTLRSALVLQIIDGPGTIVFLKKIKVKRTLLIYILQNIMLSEKTLFRSSHVHSAAVLLRIIKAVDSLNLKYNIIDIVNNAVNLKGRLI